MWSAIPRVSGTRLEDGLAVMSKISAYEIADMQIDDADGNLLKAVILRARDQLIEVHAHSMSALPLLIARLDAARSARDYAKVCDGLLASATQTQSLPPALREFATRHDLISAEAASAPFDAPALRRLKADLEAVSFAGGAATQDQVEVKRLLMFYETTLSLANGTQTRLRETLKSITQNI
ncbi:hypothetical protein [Pandoraea sp. PE-S2T-3]|uniref:hypothetical protein n=1 Tax=Pandoraea sp. PE-S2T-3 TaxID=1986993 RepID=UPI001125106A|nr:hypothetical protein [Pandoraea sp. PE-S2T-3]